MKLSALIGAGIITMLPGIALAAVCGDAAPCESVPEIDAAAGVAALATLGASVALLRQRFKR